MATSTLDVAKQLVDLCKQGKNLDAIDQLYADDIVSIEACAMPEMPQTQRGKEAIRAKNQWWVDNHDIHDCQVTGPLPNGDQFVVLFHIDVTPKVGPTAGQRMQASEAGLYTVKDGKITHEKFFYLDE